MKKCILVLVLVQLTLSCGEKTKEITITPDNSKGRDAIINNILADKNFYDEPNMHLYAAVNDGQPNVTRGLINFKEIPKNSIIDSAFLQFKFNTESIYGKENFGENHFCISRIVSPWNDQDVTWNTQPVTSPFNVVYQDKVVLSNNPNRINVTKLVQEISDDYDNSYGFQLKLINENQNTILIMASSNNPKEQLRPSLKIYYREKK